jgi:hypothetical protein
VPFDVALGNQGSYRSCFFPPPRRPSPLQVPRAVTDPSGCEARRSYSTLRRDDGRSRYTTRRRPLALDDPRDGPTLRSATRAAANPACSPPAAPAAPVISRLSRAGLAAKTSRSLIRRQITFARSLSGHSARALDGRPWSARDSSCELPPPAPGSSLRHAGPPGWTPDWSEPSAAAGGYGRLLEKEEEAVVIVAFVPTF